MSKYTISIKNLKKMNFDFGLKDYPIFDSKYRETLNNNILNYYLLYEIGYETPELFKLELNNKMQLIMPYYNNLYKAQAVALNNLFKNSEVKEKMELIGLKTIDQNIMSDSKTTSDTDSNVKAKNVYQDSPQGKLKFETIDNFSYASNINLDNSEQTSNLSSNDIINNDLNNITNNSENYEKIIEGLNGTSYAEELANIKSNIMNIDMLIIKELRDLFMLIF